MSIITGKLIKKLDPVEGENERGYWINMEVVIEYGDEFPRKLCIRGNGEDRVEELKALEIGRIYSFYVTFSSREYEGKWFTEARYVRLNM